MYHVLCYYTNVHEVFLSSIKGLRYDNEKTAATLAVSPFPEKTKTLFILCSCVVASDNREDDIIQTLY